MSDFFKYIVPVIFASVISFLFWLIQTKFGDSFVLPTWTTPFIIVMIQSLIQIGSYIKSLEDDKVNNAMSKALDKKFEKFTYKG